MFYAFSYFLSILPFYKDKDSMNLSELQSKLRRLAINDLKKAVEELINSLEESSDFYNEAIQLEGRLNQLIRDEINDIIHRDDARLDRNRIRKSLLDILEMLSDDDLNTAISGPSTFKLEKELNPKQVKDLIRQIDPSVEVSTSLYYVNCDREKSVDQVWNYFEQFYDDEKPYQFYFFSACSTQRPRSFSERLVYEIAEYIEDIEGGDQAFRYWPEPDVDRVEAFELPVGRNLRASKIRFKKFVSEKLEFKGKQGIESYLETGKPLLDYKAIAMSFVYREEDWKPFINEYFQWIIHTFNHAHVQGDCPFFLFFFAIDVSHLHSKALEDLEERKRKIYMDLEGLAGANIDTTVHLSRLMPVPKKQVKAWFSKLGVDNDAMQERLIELLVSQDTLSKTDREQFMQDGLINMDDIELFQKWLLQYANERGRGF